MRACIGTDTAERSLAASGWCAILPRIQRSVHRPAPSNLAARLSRGRTGNSGVTKWPPATATGGLCSAACCWRLCLSQPRRGRACAWVPSHRIARPGSPHDHAALRAPCPGTDPFPHDANGYSPGREPAVLGNPGSSGGSCSWRWPASSSACIVGASPASKVATGSSPWRWLRGR